MPQKAKKHQAGELERTHAVRGQTFKQLENMCDPHITYNVQARVRSDSRQGSVSIECVQLQGFISLVSLKICFSHSPDQNACGLLQYQFQSQHEKCHLFRWHFFQLHFGE
jgi:hypothetical protein